MNGGSIVKRKSEIRELDITGLKVFDKLAPLLQRLHDDGCQRDSAGNMAAKKPDDASPTPSDRGAGGRLRLA